MRPLILACMLLAGCDSAPVVRSYAEAFPTTPARHHVIFRDGDLWVGYWLDSDGPNVNGVLAKVYICPRYRQHGAPAVITDVPESRVLATEEECRPCMRRHNDLRTN